MRKIKKAVFPVAGLGTRFLPATKAMPKEMLPIVDKPLIQYAVEEAILAGITEIIFITGRNKRSIEDHFDKAYELEKELEVKNKNDLLNTVRGILPDKVSCLYIRQAEATGLGHAVLKSKAAVGDDPFAVILADDLIDSETGAIKQMLDIYEENQYSILGVETIDLKDTGSYGIVEIFKNEKIHNQWSFIKSIVEKPSPEVSISNLAVVGRYILNPKIFDLLENIQKGAGGEIQLTDAISKLLKYEKVIAYPFSGKRFDCGSKIGYLEANLSYGLRHSETSDEFRKIAKEYINE